MQKKLVIQGKQIAMHYSNPRPKFEDWLCNKVQGMFLSEGVCLCFGALHQLSGLNKVIRDSDPLVLVVRMTS